MLKFEHVSFSYGGKKILSELSFSLARGEILAITAPSGVGKSTVLNLIAGLRKPDGGRIVCNAAKIAYVFQEPRLFEWLNVEENLRAVLPKDADGALIERALATVELTDAARLYPSELSGGMKSRVSLARALVYGGDLLLLDEPFAALDEAQRTRLAARLREDCKSRGLTVVLVTHQSEDVQAMADRTLKLDEIE
jgi:NitT/TauT family transport system ATP-binding protein